MYVTLLPDNGIFTAARRAVADVLYPEGRNQRNELERAVNVDAMTGLANKGAFLLATPAAEANAHTAFIVFDANNLKVVNDTLGHTAGDYMITNIAKTIQLAASRWRVGNRCFRIGGDEFAVICSADVAGTIRDAVEKNFTSYQVGDKVVSISGCIGETFDEADRQLQDRKATRKAHGR